MSWFLSAIYISRALDYEVEFAQHARVKADGYLDYCGILETPVTIAATKIAKIQCKIVALKNG